MSPADNGPGGYPSSSSWGAGHAASGSSYPPQSPEDTLQSIYGMSFDAPNGSHSTGSSSFEPVGGRKSSPSDTDVFLAVAAQGQASQQPSLTPASHSVDSATHAAQSAAGPVNPLIAARGGNGRTAGGASNGLFPIQEVDANSSKSFDTSFGEPGNKKTIVIIVVAVLLLALIVVGAFFGIRQKQIVDAHARIDEAISLVRGTDNIIVPLDTALATELGTGVTSDNLSDLMLQSTSASTSLSSAEQLANEADGARGVLDQSSIDALDAVKSSVSARRSLIETGRILLAADTANADAVSNLAMAYSAIADANTNIQAAVDHFNAYNDALAAGDTGDIDPWVAIELENTTATNLASAQEWVNAAKTVAPDADLSALDTYIAAFSNYNTLLIQIQTNVLTGVEEDQTALYDQFNAAGLAWQDASQYVPATAADLLASTRSTVAAAQSANYASAREKCVAADETINTYLGITDASKRIGLSSSSVATTAEPISEAAPTVTDPAATTDQPADPAAVDQPVEGEVVPAEGEVVPVEGEVAPAEGEAAPVDEQPVGEGEAAAA